MENTNIADELAKMRDGLDRLEAAWKREKTAIEADALAVGCESGPKRRPCKVEWVESIVQQCMDAEVPVFVKQICLPNGKFTNKIEEFPKHLQIRQVPWAEEVEK